MYINKKIEFLPLFNKEIYDKVIEELIFDTKKTLWIVTANLKNIFVKHPNKYNKIVSIFEIFDFLIKQNIKIKILHAAKPSRSFNDYINDYEQLFSKGLDMRQCPRVHMKAIISDDKQCYVGSANFTGAGVGIRSIKKRNFELGFITNDKTYINELECQISSLWYGEECQECKLYEKCISPICSLKY